MSPPLSTRPALLDGAVGVGLAGPVLILVESFGERPTWFSGVLLATILASVATWIVWRRVPRLERSAALAFAACVVGVFLSGDGPLTFGIVWAVSLVLARTFRGAAALWLAVLLCATVAGLQIAFDGSWEVVLRETLATAVFAGFGVAFALVLHDAERVERERARLGVEHEETLTSLERANEALHRRIGTEQDLVLAQERARAARELHDGLGHRLTAIGLSLEFVERMRSRDPERAWAEVVRARVTAADALDATRRLVRAMHPVEIGTGRGTDVFPAIAEAFRSTGLDIRVAVDGERELPHEHTLLLVRFAQEGMTNVVRHSDATRVELHARTGASGIEASVEDYGSQPVTPVADGFGLRSLRARAASLGGTLTTKVMPSGFWIEIVLPLDEDSPPVGMDGPSVGPKQVEVSA